MKFQITLNLRNPKNVYILLNKAILSGGKNADFTAFPFLISSRHLSTFLAAWITIHNVPETTSYLVLFGMEQLL
jgi:hypothetical protein